MRWMSGEAAVPGVVGVLFGVGAGKSRKSKVKIPALNRKNRDLEQGTLESHSLTGGTSPVSTRAKARPTSTSADRSVRATPAKRLGEQAEAAFLARASRLGFGVAKPWGDSDRYDFIVDAGGRLWRVQVKSSHRAGRRGEYHIRMSDNSCQAYEENEIDALVCYVVPVDAWYVFPPEVFRSRRSMTLFCTSVRRLSKFEKYREAWWVLDGGSAAKAAALGKD